MMIGLNLALTGGVSSAAINAMALLGTEPEGLALDFTADDGRGRVAVVHTATPANNLYNAYIDSFLSNAGTSPKLVRQVDGTYAWAPHNLFLNSAVPATQNVTLITGATYTYTVTGSGSLAGSSGASGTATAGSPVTFVATGTTGTFTLTGSLATIQINRGAVATRYMETAGAAKYAVPFEYDGGWYGLIEPAATNLLLWSSNLGTSWSNTNSIEELKVAVAPDGSTTADRLRANTAGGTGAVNINQTVTTAPTTTYTYSHFLKADGALWARLQVFGMAAQTIQAFFNLATGVVGQTGANNVSQGIQDWGNGWYRCWITFTSDAVDTSAACVVYTADSDGDVVVALDGVSSVLCWGAQLETGSVPTSPIPTFGATVTRATDTVRVLSPGMPWGAVNTVYVKYLETSVAFAGNQTIVGMGVDVDNRADVLQSITTGVVIAFIRASAANVASVSGGGAPTVGVPAQLSARFKLNDTTASFNGAAAATPDASCTPPASVAQLVFGKAIAGGSAITSPKKLLAYLSVPRDIANADLPTWRYAA